MGQPDPERICTSIVERSNLSATHGHTTLHPTYEWLLKEVGEPLGGGDPLVHVVQLLPRSQVAPLHAGDGSGDRRSRVDRA